MELLNRKRIAVFAMGLVISAPPLQAAPPSEYSLKSVFLYSFCRFMEWPDSAFSSPNEPLIISVLGEDPFGSLLNEAVEGETYHGRPIRIEHYRTLHDVKRCQLLFISRSEASRIDQILAAVAGKGIVTVGETDGFIEKGGMISLTAEHKRVRLRVNLATLRAANVEVSSKMLRVAEIKS